MLCDSRLNVARVNALVVGLLAAANCGISVAQSTVAGVTAGGFSVSDAGAAEYSIPLRIPPGIAGMTPKLALAFSSQSGNGLFGLGGSLSGLSAIGRCAKTLAQDGERGAVNYDASDRFCLDGQRLFAVNGTYGANGTEYRTERESFARIVSYGAAGTGPEWFKVWTKSGQIFEYGNTLDSRIEAQGKTTVRLWAMNKLSDTKGNYIAASYLKDSTNGDFRPARIDYTGNDAASSPPSASIRFTYDETRPDTPPAYHAGSIVKTIYRTTNVKTYVGESEVTDYQIEYEPATQQSRVSQIKECVNQGSTCFAPTTFNWSNGTPGVVTWSWNSASIGAANSFSHYFADVNGDGLPDLIQVSKSSNQAYVGLSNGDGTFALWTWSSTSIGSANAHTHYFADVNGDGKADWIQVTNASNAGYVGLSNGDGSFATWTWNSTSIGSADAHAHYFADVDGDGRPDWIQVTKASNAGYVGLSNGDGTFSTWTWTSTAIGAESAHAHYHVDLNGDGKADWLQITKGANAGNVGLSNGDGTFSVWTWSSTNIGAANSFVHYLADANGDGKPDLVQVAKGSNNGYVGLGFGDGSFATWTWSSTSVGSANAFTHNFADMNGDGRTDWIQIAKGSNNGYVGYATGSGSYTTWSWSSTNIGADNSFAHYFVDANGDGRPDWVQILRSSNQGYVGLAHGGLQDQLLIITNGLGAVTSIDYSPLTKSSVYTKDSGASYPLLDLQVPLQVVSSASVSNGLGGSSTTHFRYGGLKAELGTGRGMLGFRWREAINAQTGIANRTEFRQDWPYLGLPSQVKTMQSSGAMLSQVDTTYNCLNPVGGGTCSISPGQRYFPFASQSVQLSNDLNGSPLPTVTTTQGDVDLFGNVGSITVTTGDGYIKTTSNTYANDSANWILGRLLRAQVTSTTP